MACETPGLHQVGRRGGGWPPAAHAQQVGKVPRIGCLSPCRSELPDPTFNMLNAFLQGLQELGYTEGQNLAIDRQYADGNSDRLGELAAELVRRNPDSLSRLVRQRRVPPSKRPAYSHCRGSHGRSGRRRAGPSLARPGGNVTGTTFLGPELVAKRLQLLREIVPGLSRVAALWHPNAYSERTMAGYRMRLRLRPGLWDYTFNSCLRSARTTSSARRRDGQRAR